MISHISEVPSILYHLDFIVNIYLQGATQRMCSKQIPNSEGTGKYKHQVKTL